jgi:hypothetical protein
MIFLLLRPRYVRKDCCHCNELLPSFVCPIFQYYTANCIGDAGAIVMGAALEKNRALTTLNLHCTV